MLHTSEIQHVGKMRFNNLDGEVRHLWGPAGMCRLPSAECTLPRAVHRAPCTQAGTHFSSTFSSAFIFLATVLNFLEEKKLVCKFRWLLQKTCLHAVCQDVERTGLSQLLWLPTLVQHVLYGSNTAFTCTRLPDIAALSYCTVLYCTISQGGSSNLQNIE